jgi:hypothetical protein
MVPIVRRLEAKYRNPAQGAASAVASYVAPSAT